MDHSLCGNGDFINTPQTINSIDHNLWERKKRLNAYSIPTATVIQGQDNGTNIFLNGRILMWKPDPRHNHSNTHNNNDPRSKNKDWERYTMERKQVQPPIHLGNSFPNQQHLGNFKEKGEGHTSIKIVVQRMVIVYIN